jgi:uncharacterized linocin/CFP29 family protein
MQVTKMDLSGDEVKLDYQALLSVSEIAFAQAREAISRELNKLQQYPLEGCYYLNAEYLERYAKQLHIASETMYTLQKGLTRQECKIVNKPEIKSQEEI